MPKRVLLTGGVGFIGHHTTEHLLKNTDWEIVILDRLNYAGNLNRLKDIEIWSKENARVTIVHHDLRAQMSPTTEKLIGHFDYVIHMAAESHVDNSITNPILFADSNILGTVHLLDWLRKRNESDCPEKILYVSTDEVYGPVHGEELHKEGEPHQPSNPYSASKAGAEDFCFAFWNTYGLPILVSNTMNNFGERQDPEKFIPKTFLSIMKHEPVTLHVKKVNDHIVDISSRCWLHARNHADGILFLLKNGAPGEKYNIVGERKDVVQMAQMISDIVDTEWTPNFVDFHSFRRGHDMHYGLDGSKMSKMGWNPPVDLFHSMEKTILWMAEHPIWL
jgi:dTDP-glucose 4,6-dehydratase